MIPTFIKPFLWSYNTDKIDLEKHKDRIIINILKFGTPQATNWIEQTYSKQEIKEVLKGPVALELDPKSRAYWSLIYGVSIPKEKKRIIEQEHVLSNT